MCAKQKDSGMALIKDVYMTLRCTTLLQTVTVLSWARDDLQRHTSVTRLNRLRSQLSRKSEALVSVIRVA